MKTCNKCKENKPLESFSRDRQANDGRRYTCKDCQKKRHSEYKQNGGLEKLIDQNHKPWFQCSKCLAGIGFGHKKAAQILSHLSPGQIYTAWNRGGVKAHAPACGSWRLYANRMAKGKPTDRMQTEAEVLYERARLQDIKTTAKWGFTWIYEWRKEQARRKSLEKYHSMTQEERDEHNKICAANHKKRMANNPEAKKRQLENQKKWRKKNPAKQRESVKKSIAKRKKNEPAYRALCNLRNRFSDLMKTTRKGGSKFSNGLLGMTTKEFHYYLESKFTDKMTWDNYGIYWDVDHIIPCSKWDYNDPEQVKRCWHYTNLQPLDKITNQTIKRDKIIDGQMSLLLSYV